MPDSIPTTSLSNGGGTAGQPNSYSPGPPYQTGVSLGNGIAVYGGLLATSRLPNLEFRSLRAGNGITLALSADNSTITIVNNSAVQQPVFISPRDMVISQNGIVYSFSLSNTSVAAGTYTMADIVVDSKGRILQAMSNSNAVAANTNIGIVSNDLLVSNSPVNNNGTFTVDLSNTGVVSGTYTLATVAVDSKGRIRSISNGSLSNAGLPNGTVTSVLIAGSNAISAMSGNSTTKNVFYGLDLTNTGVTPGSYSLASFTVDAQGRISNAVSGTETDVGVTHVSLVGGNAITVTGTTITTAGTFAVDLTQTGVVAGVYACPTIGVDAQGRINFVQTGTAVQTLTVNNFDMTLNGQNVTGQGSALTGTGTVVIALTNTGVTPGTYTSADIVVDTKGRIHQINNGGSGGTVKSVSLAVGAGLTASGSPITTSGTFDISLATTGVQPGDYTKVTVDAVGRVTQGSSLIASDITAALGYNPINPSFAVFTALAKGVAPGSGDSSTNIPTTAWVQGEIATAVANAVAALRAEFMANAGA